MEYISATTLIRAMIPQDETYFNEFVANRGTVLHHAYRLALLGKLDRSSLHPDLTPYMDSFDAWRESTAIEVMGTELELKDDSLKLIGHLDFYGKIDGLLSVVDYKNGAPFKSHRIQLALYRHLAMVNGKVVLRKHSLHVHKTGKRATLLTHSDPADDAYAMHLVGAYNARGIYGTNVPGSR